MGKKPVTCVKKLLSDVLKLLPHIITASHKNRENVAAMRSAEKNFITNPAKYLETVVTKFITTFGKNCKNAGNIPKLSTMKNM